MDHCTKNSPNLDQLYNNQDAQCYLFAIFVMKMAKKYEPELSLASSWLSSLASSWSLSSLSSLASSWSSWSLSSLSSSSSLSISDNEKAKWELLYNRMIAAKKRYEAAGGEVKKNGEYVR